MFKKVQYFLITLEDSENKKLNEKEYPYPRFVTNLDYHIFRKVISQPPIEPHGLMVVSVIQYSFAVLPLNTILDIFL